MLLSILRSVWLVSGILGLLHCGEAENRRPAQDSAVAAAAPFPPFELRQTLEHDPKAFTQGLVFYNNSILESTGGDSSWIAAYDIATATYKRKVALASGYFGEGITVLNNKIYQLTWKSRLGFVYDARSFEKIGEFTYPHDGWGITHDGRHLIISDGTDQLHYLDTLTLTEVATKSIRHNKQKATQLNELEFIEGYLYANQWETEHILKIDTGKAEVVQELDFSFLVRDIKKIYPQADVLNGIAYDAASKNVYITGKYWPRMYVVKLRE